jgi:hypothetical protein
MENRSTGFCDAVSYPFQIPWPGEEVLTHKESNNETPSRTPTGQFAKGVSGNPSGRPASTQEIRAAAGKYTLEAIDFLGSVLSDETASRQQRQQAAIVLLRFSGKYDDDNKDDKNEQHNHEDDALNNLATRLNKLYNNQSLP